MGGDALTCCARPDAENNNHNNQNNDNNGTSRRSLHPTRPSNECGSQVSAAERQYVSNAMIVLQAWICKSVNAGLFL